MTPKVVMFPHNAYDAFDPQNLSILFGISPSVKPNSKAFVKSDGLFWFSMSEIQNHSFLGLTLLTDRRIPIHSYSLFTAADDKQVIVSVSYTHLTLPTNREV